MLRPRDERVDVQVLEEREHSVDAERLVALDGATRSPIGLSR